MKLLFAGFEEKQFMRPVLSMLTLLTTFYLLISISLARERDKHEFIIGHQAIAKTISFKKPATQHTACCLDAS